MASFNLSGVLTSVGSLFGSNASGAQPLVTQIVEQVAVGAAASGFLAAIQHPDVKSALLPFDPLNLAGKPAALNATAAPQVAAPVAAAPVAAKTIPASVWATLPAASQTLMLTDGYLPGAG